MQYCDTFFLILVVLEGFLCASDSNDTVVKGSSSKSVWDENRELTPLGRYGPTFHLKTAGHSNTKVVETFTRLKNPAGGQPYFGVNNNDFLPLYSPLPAHYSPYPLQPAAHYSPYEQRRPVYYIPYMPQLPVFDQYLPVYPYNTQYDPPSTVQPKIHEINNHENVSQSPDTQPPTQQ